MGNECAQQCEAPTQGGCVRDIFRSEGKNRSNLDLSDIANNNYKQKRSTRRQHKQDSEEINQKQNKDMKQSMFIEEKVTPFKKHQTIPDQSIIRKLQKSPQLPQLEQSAFYFKSNLKYNGSSLAGLPHKNGNISFGDGSRLMATNFDHGHLPNDSLISLSFPDGAKYEGNTSNTKANGKGRFIFSDQSFYEGEWKDDRAHGKGRHVLSEEHFYEGDFEHGFKSGEGVYYNQDGSFYQGNFKNDRFHGEGVFTTFINRIYRGIWENGLLQGQGEIDYQNGDKYRGQFKDGMRHGFGAYLYSDGKRQWIGQWKNNRQHGRGKYTDQNGSVVQGQWNDGKKLEEALSFNPNPFNKSMNRMIVLEDDLQSKGGINRSVVNVAQ